MCEELARGGMGVVHRVRDRYAERDLAQKRLMMPRDGLRPRLIALFQNEYDTLAQLAHPRIVEVYEYGVDAVGPYYTMELLSGGDLAHAAPLSAADTCSVLRDVASALALIVILTGIVMFPSRLGYNGWKRRRAAARERAQ